MKVRYCNDKRSGEDREHMTRIDCMGKEGKRGARGGEAEKKYNEKRAESKEKR